MKFSGVTILQGVEFSIFPIDFEWALQQCSATALPVMTGKWRTRFKHTANEITWSGKLRTTFCVAYEKEKRRLSTWRDSHVVRCLLGLPIFLPLLPAYRRRTAKYPHHHRYRRITQPSSSATGGVREAPVARPAFCRSKSPLCSVFVMIGRGRTTSSKVTILACVGEFKLATPNLFNFLTHPHAYMQTHRRQNGRLCSTWNAALEYVDQRKRRIFRITAASIASRQGCSGAGTPFPEFVF